MDPEKSVRLTLSCGAGYGRAIRWPARPILGNLDECLTMSVQRSLAIFSLKVSVASRRLLILVIQDGANQM
jgi:hypothetical protein